MVSPKLLEGRARKSLPNKAAQQDDFAATRRRRSRTMKRIWLVAQG